MIVFIFKESCSLLFYCTIIYFCYVSVNEVIVWTVNFILFLLEWKTFILLFELKTEKWSKNAPFKHELLIILAQCKFCSFAKKLLLNLSTQHAGSHIYSTFCLYFWLWWKQLVLNKTQAITFMCSTLATVFSIHTVMHAFHNKLIIATVITTTFQ